MRSRTGLCSTLVLYPFHNDTKNPLVSEGIIGRKIFDDARVWAPQAEVSDAKETLIDNIGLGRLTTLTCQPLWCEEPCCLIFDRLLSCLPSPNHHFLSSQLFNPAVASSSFHEVSTSSSSKRPCYRIRGVTEYLVYALLSCLEHQHHRNLDHERTTHEAGRDPS